MADGWFEKSKLQYEGHEPAFLDVFVSKPAVNKETKQDYIVRLSGKLAFGFEQTIESFYSKETTVTHYSFYDFDESGLDAFQFKISNCFDRKFKKHFMFRLPSSFLIWHRKLCMKKRPIVLAVLKLKIVLSWNNTRLFLKTVFCWA